MQNKLRKLAEQWKAGDFEERACAYQLLSILDAECDGGAVGVSKEAVLALINQLLSAGTFEAPDWAIRVAAICMDCNLAESTHPARSGGVSDADVRDAARYRFIRDEQATIIYKRKQDGEWGPLVDTYSTSTLCASLDTDIDTAMLATTPSPGESNNKPTDCSGDPSSCPDNEGRGCYCSDLRRVGESA